jgi:hypothetical protein
MAHPLGELHSTYEFKNGFGLTGMQGIRANKLVPKTLRQEERQNYSSLQSRGKVPNQYDYSSLVERRSSIASSISSNIVRGDKVNFHENDQDGAHF